MSHTICRAVELPACELVPGHPFSPSAVLSASAWTMEAGEGRRGTRPTTQHKPSRMPWGSPLEQVSWFPFSDETEHKSG